MKTQVENASELDGFEDLNPEDQEKITKAWETGKVAPEDIPESAKKPQDEEGEGEEKKPKGKRAAKKTDVEGEEKPKRVRKPKKVIIFVSSDVLIVDLVADSRPLKRMTNERSLRLTLTIPMQRRSRRRSRPQPSLGSKYGFAPI